MTKAVHESKAVDLPVVLLPMNTSFRQRLKNEIEDASGGNDLPPKLSFRVGSLVIWGRLTENPLLFHIHWSQLRWFGRLTRMVLLDVSKLKCFGHVLLEANFGVDPGHAGEITSLCPSL